MFISLKMRDRLSDHIAKIFKSTQLVSPKNRFPTQEPINLVRPAGSVRDRSEMEGKLSALERRMEGRMNVLEGRMEAVETTVDRLKTKRQGSSGGESGFSERQQRRTKRGRRCGIGLGLEVHGKKFCDPEGDGKGKLRLMYVCMEGSKTQTPTWKGLREALIRRFGGRDKGTMFERLAVVKQKSDFEMLVAQTKGMTKDKLLGYFFVGLQDLLTGMEVARGVEEASRGARTAGRTGDKSGQSWGRYQGGNHHSKIGTVQIGLGRSGYDETTRREGPRETIASRAGSSIVSDGRKKLTRSCCRDVPVNVGETKGSDHLLGRIKDGLQTGGRGGNNKRGRGGNNKRGPHIGTKNSDTESIDKESGGGGDFGLDPGEGRDKPRDCKNQSRLNKGQNRGVVIVVPGDLPPVRNTIQRIMLTVNGYYQAFSREFMRVNGTTQAPVMNFAAETSLGVVTIKTLNMVNRFLNNYLKLVAMDATVFFHANGLVGLSLSYALTLKESQVFWSRMYSMMSDHIIYAERIKQFIHIPTLFKGSIKTNLDPLGFYEDDEIWKALEKCQLKDTVGKLPSLLDFSVSDEDGNWSFGQCQLFCLSRVLLKWNKILVLDEATVSIDSAIDAILQQLIRQEFAEGTIILEDVLTIQEQLSDFNLEDKVAHQADHLYPVERKFGSLVGCYSSAVAILNKE
ncbi:hypothetical protein V8G54_006863 [Vigna mungo]|uniref:ABC transporter domain-containing protein n=1 Tax=Vigna mungo TaxID=3915 RepID=A0AAQ3NZU3_VIGMU